MGLFDFLQPERSLDWMRSRAMRDNPELMKHHLANLQAKNFATHADSVFGNMAAPEQTEMQSIEMEGPQQPIGYGPLMQGPGNGDPVFPDRGLMQVNQTTQEAQDPTGLFVGETPQRIRELQSAKALMQTGNPLGISQQGDLLKQFHNNSGSMARQQQGQQAKINNPQLARGQTAIEAYDANPEKMKNFWRDQNINKKPLVSISNPLESIDQKIEAADRLGTAADNRDYIKQAVGQGDEAYKNLSDINSAINLLENGADTGFGSTWITKAKQLGNRFGLEGTDTANEEQLQVFMGNFVMERIAQTKGAVSQKEMELFREYSPNMDKSKAGNMGLLKYQKAILQRQRDKGKAVRKWRSDGVNNAEIAKRLYSYNDENPLVITDYVGEAQAATAPPPPPPGHGEPYQDANGVWRSDKL